MNSREDRSREGKRAEDYLLGIFKSPGDVSWTRSVPFHQLRRKGSISNHFFKIVFLASAGNEFLNSGRKLIKGDDSRR